MALTKVILMYKNRRVKVNCKAERGSNKVVIFHSINAIMLNFICLIEDPA
jgi:hypothetical protein